MAIRPQNLETIAPVLATFSIQQTGGIDELTDANIGEPVQVTGNYEVGPVTSGSSLVGKLIALTLSDADQGRRLATVQIGGICRFKTSSPYPVVGNRVVGGTGGTVRQAAAVSGDPAGGNVARGTVLEINGITDCMLFLN